jgi:hypothetical protein
MRKSNTWKIRGEKRGGGFRDKGRVKRGDGSKRVSHIQFFIQGWLVSCLGQFLGKFWRVILNCV